jgi:hypothetical protein
MQEVYRQHINSPEWLEGSFNTNFDYSQPGFNNQGTTSGSNYGPTNDPESGYVAWHNPHGGSTFIGIRPDGTKERVSRAQAIEWGYTPAPRTTFGPGMTNPVTTYPGGGGGGGGVNIPNPGGGGGGGNIGDPNLSADMPPGSTPPPGTGGGPGPGPGPGVLPPTPPGVPGSPNSPINWDWSYWDPNSDTGAPPYGGGAYDPNDYAFERYVPGQESPWGIPEVAGGNRDFYRNQFLNLLRDEQNFRDRQRGADEARQDAFENPLEAAPVDWSWANLPDVEVAGAPTYSTASWITPGETTFEEIVRHYRPSFSDEGQAFWGRVLEDEGNNLASTHWSTQTDPNRMIGNLNNSGANRQHYIDLINKAFSPTGQTVSQGGVPEGYALPI